MCILWWQSWIFSIITSVFSVTWSFRNHSNMLIWCFKNHFLLSMLKTVVLLNIFVETVIIRFFHNSLTKRKFKRTAFIWNRFSLWQYRSIYDHLFDKLPFGYASPSLSLSPASLSLHIMCCDVLHHIKTGTPFLHMKLKYIWCDLHCVWFSEIIISLSLMTALFL